MAKLSRRMFLVGSALAFPYLYLERLRVAVRRYRVPVEELPAAFEGFTILHLSDLHEKQFGPNNAELIRLIARQNFDMIAFTGDLVVGPAPSLEPALQLIAGIKRFSDSPIYSVTGNHDWWKGRVAEFNQRLTEAGVVVLSNDAAAVEAEGGGRLWVVGVDDPITWHDRLEEALDGADKESPRLLLCHSPHLFPRVTGHGIDLMLSGHTHGGQFRIPFLGACYVPSLGFFPRWDYGLYRSGRSTLIVSGGLGESGVPIRINIRPEIALITLVRDRGKAPDTRNATG